MNKKILIVALTLLLSLTAFAQRPEGKKVTVSGKVIEKGTNLPLEYATIVFENSTTKQLSGGITDENGVFKFEVIAGNYNVRAEFISFKSVIIPQKVLMCASQCRTDHVCRAKGAEETCAL